MAVFHPPTALSPLPTKTCGLRDKTARFSLLGRCGAHTKVFSSASSMKKASGTSTTLLYPGSVVRGNPGGDIGFASQSQTSWIDCPTEGYIDVVMFRRRKNRRSMLLFSQVSIMRSRASRELQCCTPLLTRDRRNLVYPWFNTPIAQRACTTHVGTLSLSSLCSSSAFSLPLAK